MSEAITKNPTMAPATLPTTDMPAKNADFFRFSKHIGISNASGGTKGINASTKAMRPRATGATGVFAKPSAHS